MSEQNVLHVHVFNNLIYVILHHCRSADIFNKCQFIHYVI